jgi:hypothetical protein
MSPHGGGIDREPTLDPPGGKCISKTMIRLFPSAHPHPAPPPLLLSLSQHHKSLRVPSGREGGVAASEFETLQLNQEEGRQGGSSVGGARDLCRIAHVSCQKDGSACGQALAPIAPAHSAPCSDSSSCAPSPHVVKRADFEQASHACMREVGEGGKEGGHAPHRGHPWRTSLRSTCKCSGRRPG